MTDNDRELFSLSDEQQKLIEAGFRLKGTPVIEKVDMHEIMTGRVYRKGKRRCDSSVQRVQRACLTALLYGNYIGEM